MLILLDENGGRQAIRDQIWNLLNDPSQQVTDVCKRDLLRPALVRLAQLDPNVMPISWVANPGDESPPLVASLVRRTFWSMCRLVSDAPSTDNAFFIRFGVLWRDIRREPELEDGENIQHKPKSRKNDLRIQIVGSRYWRVHYQMGLLCGHDTAELAVEYPAVRGCGSWYFIDLLANGGLLRYALTLARAIRDVPPANAPELAEFCRLVERALAVGDPRFWILAVALKDKGSPLHVLSADLIRRIASFARFPEPTLRDAVLRPFIADARVVEVVAE